jgi:hypothetical protein|tara:strand:+ start:256 stop:459 length:204 start_codon:yes stop_codon:yes gene_type:complete
MIYEVYSLQNNLASLETTVRFRVWEQLNTLRRLVDECEVLLEGRYDLNDEGMTDEVERIYTLEVTNA